MEVTNVKTKKLQANLQAFAHHFVDDNSDQQVRGLDTPHELGKVKKVVQLEGIPKESSSGPVEQPSAASSSVSTKTRTKTKRSAKSARSVFDDSTSQKNQNSQKTSWIKSLFGQSK